VDFELDDEQLELQRVVRDVLDRECPPSLVRAVVEGRDGGEQLWKTLVDLDWPGLTIPASCGGTGLSAIELVITLEELGRAADPTPFLATTSQYVPLVRSCGDDAQQSTLLAAVCAGGTGAVAWSADCTASPNGALLGTARNVLDGDRAERVAVVTETGVFIVDGANAAATRTPTFDGSLHVADLTFDAAPVDHVLGAEGVDRAMEMAVTGMAINTVGACQRILELVLGHIRQRHQFGVAIGSFQAVKHMAVDMYVAIERARALCHFAALTIAEDDERRTVAASMAKVGAGDCQRVVARHGIQLFGGLGYTWENDLQLYVRRAKAGELLLGTSKDHRARVARAALASAAR
jgi:alkylation response protein AidB-like acyl-CoA dehydrogenase